ncbi:hypothetical protein MMC22_000241 [Lobaria immixta]|nr:hypothetical protein [Lobaria immixta]
MADNERSDACCTVPKAIVKDYAEKGKYITVDGMQTYVTGSSSATTGILFVYDIFRFSPQGIQGADILAHTDPSHEYQVFVPDFLRGQNIDPGLFPPDTEEKQQKMNEFIGGPANIPKTVDKVSATMKELAQQAPGIKKWGAVGFCWGGKVVVLASQEGTPFSAAAEAHPAMVAPDDAKGITIPVCVLASKDENPDDVKAFGGALTGKKHIETFGDQVHGWMGARAKLDDQRVKSEYERGYKVLLDFFAEHL